jgi:hypothetical protein
MIGAVTGEASGLVVLDFDAEGKDVFDMVADYERRFSKLPQTMTVKTPRGLHFYFRMRPGVDIRNSAGLLGEGIDVRGNGGYVIFPGSVRADGRIYQLIELGE